MRTFYKNFDQYLNDKLNAPATNTTEDIVMCDMSFGQAKHNKDIATQCTFINSGRNVTVDQNGEITEEITKRVKGKRVVEKIPYNDHKRKEEL